MFASPSSADIPSRLEEKTTNRPPLLRSEKVMSDESSGCTVGALYGTDTLLVRPGLTYACESDGMRERSNNRLPVRATLLLDINIMSVELASEGLDPVHDRVLVRIPWTRAEASL